MLKPGTLVSYDPVAANDAGSMRVSLKLKNRGVGAREFAEIILNTCNLMEAVEADLREADGNSDPVANYLLAECGIEGNEAWFVLWDGVIRHPEKAIPIATITADPDASPETLSALADLVKAVGAQAKGGAQ